MKKAFTIIEVIVVVVIIGMLAALIIPNCVESNIRSKVRKEHPDYTESQVNDLARLRMQKNDDRIELSFPKIQQTQTNVNTPHIPDNAVIIDKMVINDLTGNKNYTIVVAETNYYTVTEENYYRSLIGSKPKLDNN